MSSLILNAAKDITTGICNAGAGVGQGA